MKAYRAMAELAIGRTLRMDEHIDHDCLQRRCVCWSHFNLTTNVENVKRMQAIRHGKPAPAMVKLIDPAIWKMPEFTRGLPVLRSGGSECPF